MDLFLNTLLYGDQGVDYGGDLVWHPRQEEGGDDQKGDERRLPTDNLSLHRSRDLKSKS